MKIIADNLKCPRCYSTNLYKYGKDPYGNQKYQCIDCKRQWAPDTHVLLNLPKEPKYERCPMCNKASFLHHDFEYYSNLRCCDKKCNHSFFRVKKAQIPDVSSNSFEYKDFSLKGMRHPLHIILKALFYSFIGNLTLRKISESLKLIDNISVSHVTIYKWIQKFAPMLQKVAEPFKEQLTLSQSDEWHIDETYIKISGKTYYLWLAIDSETRVIIDFHLSEYRDTSAAFSLLNSCKENFGSPKSMIVTDRYRPYVQPIKYIYGDTMHLRVEDFADDISNNIIEAFNGQFKAWHKSHRGFKSFESANLYIATYIFFYNFIRPHQSLNNMTPAQVAGAKYSEKQRRACLLIS